VQDNPDLRRLLWYFLGATRGGETRARLIHQLRKKPGNINQLSIRIGMEYRTVEHHMKVLKKNSLVDSAGETYGVMYFLHPWLEAHMDIFDDVCAKLKFKLE
jgi:DNA-binding transcriptional ArsR family regulator